MTPNPNCLLITTTGGAAGGEVELSTKRGGANEFHHNSDFVSLPLASFLFMAHSSPEVRQAQLPQAVHRATPHVMENLLVAEKEEAGDNSASRLGV